MVDQHSSRPEFAEPLINRTSDVVSFDIEENGLVTDGERKDPFLPFDDIPTEAQNILTVRAVVVGLFCGLLVGASNIYLGLKAGWTSSANIFGSIVGFALLKPCARMFPRILLLNQDFGVGENNIVQTIATAAGGMSNVYTSAMPALYQLNLLSNRPSQDFGRLTTITVAGSLFALFFATPLRDVFIVRLARELGLIFPSSSATASAIKSLHLAVEGTTTAKTQLRGLVVAFGFAAGLRIVSEYAIGILWDWHVFTWLITILGPSEFFMHAESWGWYIEWTPAFFGSGMLVGLNVSLSFLLGSFLAWGLIGPMLTYFDIAQGLVITSDPFWAMLRTYSSLRPEDASAIHPSPRYWLLWPGVLAMMGVSITEVLCQWRIFYLGGRALWRAASNSFSRYPPLSKALSESSEYAADEIALDNTACKGNIPTWFWSSGLLVATTLCVLVMKLQFHMPVLETLLALLLSAFFSLLAVQSSGATDITPLTAASKASQVILGGVTSSQGWPVIDAQRLNLLGGALSSISASQASDLVGDFRVGYLLQTSPRIQWHAQAIGTLCACIFTPALYVIFSNAYTCINDAKAQACAFKTPSASAWRAVAIAVSDPTFPIPPSAANFAVIFTVLACLSTLIRRKFLSGRREWLRSYWPDFMIIGLAFVIPATQYAMAMVIGALISAVWVKRNTSSFEIHASPIAAGLIAGEGIGGLVSALLAIAGVKWGTSVGCPAGIC